MADDDWTAVSVGCEFMCNPAIKDSLLDLLKEMAEEILDSFSEDDIIDYGVG